MYFFIEFSLWIVFYLCRVDVTASYRVSLIVIVCHVIWISWNKKNSKFLNRDTHTKSQYEILTTYDRLLDFELDLLCLSRLSRWRCRSRSLERSRSCRLLFDRDRDLSFDGCFFSFFSISTLGDSTFGLKTVIRLRPPFLAVTCYFHY